MMTTKFLAGSLSRGCAASHTGSVPFRAQVTSVSFAMPVLPGCSAAGLINRLGDPAASFICPVRLDPSSVATSTVRHRTPLWIPKWGIEVHLVPVGHLAANGGAGAVDFVPQLLALGLFLLDHLDLAQLDLRN